MIRLLAALSLTAASIAACVGALPGATLDQPGAGAAGTGGSASSRGGAPGRGGSGGGGAAGAGGGPGCERTGVRLAPSDFAWNIALSGTGDSASLFWVRHPSTAAAGLVKVPVTGGEPVVLASANANYNAVAVDAMHVYWSDGSDATRAPTDILRADLDGGNATTLVAGQPGINAIAVGGDGVYFTTTAGTVMKVAIDGGTPTLLGARPSAAAEIAVDAANVYWSDLAGEIVKAGIAGGTDPVVLAKMDAAPDSIAIDATYIYWVNSFGYALARVSLAGGGQPEQVWPGGIATCAGTTAWTRTVAVDATGIYWTDLAGNVFAALPGQPARARVVANMGSSGLRGAADIVLDSTTVYWMNSLGVFRAAR